MWKAPQCVMNLATLAQTGFRREANYAMDSMAPCSTATAAWTFRTEVTRFPAQAARSFDGARTSRRCYSWIWTSSAD